MLPVVLAGPILRRVTARRVSVWIALSVPATADLAVWAGDQTSTGPLTVASGDAPVATVAGVQTRRFAEHLHVAVVTATTDQPAPALAAGLRHSYDLHVHAGATDAGLLGLGLLADAGANRPLGTHATAPRSLALGYTPGTLPGFVTCPADLDGLRLAQTSCRKAHAEGPDALAWLDDLVDPTVPAHEQHRPHQLFLTGDQIYADDVAAAVLPMASHLGAALLGADIDDEDLLTGPRFERLEVEPGRFVDGSTRNVPETRRGRLVADKARLTTTAGDSHLLTFAEFAAMYLCAWSPAAWRGLSTADQVFTDDLESEIHDMLTNWEDCFKTTAKWRGASEADFEKVRERVERFRDLVPKVARVLANVPTYMMFDDHEVTDDWYLNGTWRDRVLGAPLGRDVMRNGLAAFAVFQAWGNDPEGWERTVDGDDRRPLLDAIGGMFPAAGALPEPGKRGEVEQLLGLAGAPSRIAWHFAVDGPLHRVAVLDSRTRRGYPSPVGPPRLLGASLDAQLPKGPFTDGRRLLVVVATAPVLGTELLDRFVAPLAAATIDAAREFKALISDEHRDPCRAHAVITGGEEFDAESWAADELGTEALLARMATYGGGVILSGDVHYAAAFVLDYWRKGRDTADRIVQLTSSAAHNPWPQIVQASIRAYSFGHRLLTGGFPVERLGWTERSGVRLAGSATVSASRRVRMKTTPALLPADGWPPGTSIAADAPPDWRWRMDMLVDARPDADRPTAVRAPALSATLAPADPLPGLTAIAARQQTAALTHPPFEHLRRMIFAANVGTVTFAESGGGPLTATSAFWSSAGPTASEASDNTIHTVPLVPPAGTAAPALETDG